MRHFSRHLQATVQDQVEAHLVTTGWLPPADPTGFVTLFGAQPVIFQRQRPDEHLLKSVQPNLVTVSFGAQSDDEDQQMGGGLVAQDHGVFVDIYAENDAVALALSEDIRDLFVGRTAAGRFFQVVDQVTATPVVGYRGEYDEVLRAPADRELPNVRWQLVQATVLVHLPGEA